MSSGRVVRVVVCCLVLLCVAVCCGVLCPLVLCCAALLRPVLCCCMQCFFVSLVWCRGLVCRALGRCLSHWGPALSGAVFCGVSPLCALCCLRVAVVWWCVLLFAAVLCAVVVLACLDVRCLSSPLCAALCCAVLVRLRCAFGVVSAVFSARCCGVLLCVVLLPLVCCSAVLGLAVRGRLLVACFGANVPVWQRRLLPCG